MVYFKKYYVLTTVFVLLGFNVSETSNDNFNHTSEERHTTSPPVLMLQESPKLQTSVVLPKISLSFSNNEYVFFRPQHEIDNEYWTSLLNYSALPDDDAAKVFITSFSSDLHRRILATQLSFCPLIPLCSYGLDNATHWLYHSCCQPCSCDDECVDYCNCCPDVKPNLQQFFEYDVRRSSCIPLHLKEDYTMSQYDYSAYGISECRATSTYEGNHKCVQDYGSEDLVLTDILPVWHNHSNTLFRNIHCALCNGVSSKEVDYFKPEIGCYTSPPGIVESASEIIQYVYQDDNCDIGFKLAFANIYHCTMSISKCNVTGQWVDFDTDYEKACNMYTSVVDVDGRLFKNVFCALCNGIEIRERDCLIHRGYARPYSFTGILAVSLSDKPDHPAGGKKCGSGLIYHQLMDECVRVRCSPQRYLEEGECVNNVEQWTSYNYAVSLSLTPTVTHVVPEALHIVNHVAKVLKTSLEEMFLEKPEDKLKHFYIDIILKSNVSCDRIYTYDLLEANLTQFLFRVNFTINEKHSRDAVVSSLMNTVRLDIVNDIDGMENETLVVQLVNGYEHDFNVGRKLLENSSEIDNGIVETNGTPRVIETFCSTFENKVLVTLLPPKQMEDNSFDKEEFVPVLSLLPCPMISILNDPWEVNDEGVLFTESGHMFNHTQFYITENDTLLLCIDQYFELKSKKIVPERSLSAEHIVSIACTSVSVVLLLITLLVFSVLSQLRTLPGKNNIAVFINLLLAQVLYLVGSFSRFEQDSFVCKLVGILTHFFWLLVVFWMNVCTFHMYRTMTKTKVVYTGTGNKKYLLYHLYYCIAAAIFVSINILVSSVTSGNTDIGYGIITCYVSSQEMLVYTFGIPLAVVVVSNLGMFIVVIVTITKSSAVQKNVQNERNDIVVFARLSTLTGVTWIFGFVYMWTRVTALSYIFIVLNASQGVFLFVSFICTRRVVKIAGQKYSALSRNETSSQKRTRLTDMRK